MDKIGIDVIHEFVDNSNLIEGYDFPCAMFRDSRHVKNHLSAFNWVVDNYAIEITPEVIKLIHSILMRNLLAKNHCGHFRKCKVWVGGHLKDSPSLIQEGLSALCDVIKLGPNKNTNIEDWCMCVHNEFECIHPFIDGNGRTGRLLLNMLRLKYGLDIQIIYFDNRIDYYNQIKKYEKKRGLVNEKEEI